MPKVTQTIIFSLLTSQLLGQNLHDTILNYRKDYYWDSTLYKSEMTYYIEKHIDTLYEKAYPVLLYEGQSIISEKPFVTKEVYYTNESCQEPKRYFKTDDSIFVQRYVTQCDEPLSEFKYILNEHDTIYYNSGFSSYLGEKEIQINQQSFRTFCFLEEYKTYYPPRQFFKREIYLDKSTLIPIKTISTSYEFESGQKTMYYTITTLSSTGNEIPNYKYAEELVLYQDTCTKWTTKQRNEFIRLCSAEKISLCACLLSKLEGRISFFEFEKSDYFRSLLLHSDCK